MKTFLQSGAPVWLPIMLVIAVLCAAVYPADAVWAEAEAEEHGEEHRAHRRPNQACWDLH
jgi:hypothetical protein